MEMKCTIREEKSSVTRKRTEEFRALPLYMYYLFYFKNKAHETLN